MTLERKKINVLLTKCVRLTRSISLAPIRQSCAWLRNNFFSLLFRLWRVETCSDGQQIAFYLRQTKNLKKGSQLFFVRLDEALLPSSERLRPLTISPSDEVEFVQQPCTAAAAERWRRRRVMQVCLLKCVWKLCIKMCLQSQVSISIRWRREEELLKHLRMFFWGHRSKPNPLSEKCSQILQYRIN